MITGYQTKTIEPKAVTDLKKSIKMHEQALADARTKADAAATALNDYLAREAARLLASLRPGQMGVILPPDKERDRLEEAAQATAAEVNRLDVKLHWLQGMLKKEVEKK